MWLRQKIIESVLQLLQGIDGKDGEAGPVGEKGEKVSQSLLSIKKVEMKVKLRVKQLGSAPAAAPPACV